MILFALPALAAAAYYLLAVIAAVRWSSLTSATPAADLPPISILKPIHGRDPHLYEAIRSHALQQYSDFEILFGHNDPNDAALPDLERLRGEFPHIPISIHATPTDAPNAKAGVLAALARRGRATPSCSSTIATSGSTPITSGASPPNSLAPTQAS